jgi:transposase
MIAITAHMRILVAVEAIDFRAGIDGIARICRQELQSDPFSGALFVFVNKRRTAIKVLAYDQRGFWLCHRRLSAGRFRHWPGGPGDKAQVLEAHELQLLLVGGDPAAAQAAPVWRPLSLPAAT